jgi:hypothetical protein
VLIETQTLSSVRNFKQLLKAAKMSDKASGSTSSGSGKSSAYTPYEITNTGVNTQVCTSYLP